MTHVLSLIATKRTRAVTLDVAQQCQSALPGASQLHWLDKNIACDILFSPARAHSLEAIEAGIQTSLGALPVDIAIIKAQGRAKQLLIADMDSTIIEQECIDELGAALGLRDKIAAITERAMRGELDFEAALNERVAFLKGLDVTIIDQLLRDHISLTPGAKTLVQTMRKRGAATALVSGGFTAFASEIAARTGFQHVQANELLVDNEKLTGMVAKPILGQDAKRQALIDLCGSNNIDTQDALAVGDGANDLAMITTAGLGVAFHAKPKVAKAARVRINHGDLTSLLYLQGISADQFAS